MPGQPHDRQSGQEHQPGQAQHQITHLEQPRPEAESEHQAERQEPEQQRQRRVLEQSAGAATGRAQPSSASRTSEAAGEQKQRRRARARRRRPSSESEGQPVAACAGWYSARGSVGRGMSAARAESPGRRPTLAASQASHCLRVRVRHQIRACRLSAKSMATPRYCEYSVAMPASAYSQLLRAV